MFANKRFFSRWAGLSVLIFLAASAGRAQDSAVDEIKYKEDYDRVQKIAAITQPIKRADQFITLYKERPDMDEKLRYYADGLFLRDLEALTKQRNFVAVRGLCERAIKVRPKFGEAYLHYGFVLKQEKKLDEAMNAFAKCFLIPNQYQARAKQQLDIVYRMKSGGSMVGQDKLIAAVKKDLKM